MEDNKLLKLFFAILMVTMLGMVSYAIEPIAVFTVGNEGNITITDADDGHIFETEILGIKAMKLVPNTTPESVFMYFTVKDEVRDKIDPNAYMVLDIYVDGGLGKSDLQHNSIKSGAFSTGEGFLFYGDNKWTKVLAQFKDFQPLRAANGNDFRFIMPKEMALARIEIYNDKPDVEIPDLKEVFMEKLKTESTKISDNMSYVFGNDASTASAILFKLLGVTSVESYVTWETCERAAKDEWDFSKWDNQVKVLKEADLKWVPFLIAGPAYSTPNWFRASEDHFPCACLEHGISSKIESLWNPNMPAYVDRFLKKFAERYENQGIIESVLLGIQGDFGEAIYSASGGGWTFEVPGVYHNHLGFWCNDPYALADFKEYMKNKYKSVQKLNKEWNSKLKSFDEIKFPFYNESEQTSFLKSLENDPKNRRYYLDFIAWYRDSMTDFADWWMETTRKYFPNTDIYLCTGGVTSPELGAHFADQCKVAAKHGAGVRITNEASDYGTNMALTRQVATAGKHYGAYFGFEPAGAEDFFGIPARIYNATASGAIQLHDYNPNVVDSPKNIEQQKSHIKYLFKTDPIVPIALWYSDTDLTLKWLDVMPQTAKMRDYFDFDMVDESLVDTNALARNKILVISYGSIMETSTAKKITNWAKNGGIVYVIDIDSFESVEGKSDPEKTLFPNGKQGGKVGKGYIERVSDMNTLSDKIEKDLERLDYPLYKMTEDGVYYTQIEEERLFIFSKNDEDKEVTVKYKGKEYKTSAKARSITDLYLK